MTSIKLRFWTFLFTYLLATAVYAQETKECPMQKGQRLNAEKIWITVIAHNKWLEKKGWLDPTISGRANFCNADLSGIDLSAANLKQANLTGANLTGVDLTEADLTGADLTEANLTGANLTGASLKAAKLVETNLSNARLTNVDLTNARYESVSTLAKEYVSGIRGLKTIKFSQGRRNSVADLRQMLKDAGHEVLAREVTFAIQRQTTDDAINQSQTRSIAATVGYLRRIFLEFPTEYGLNFIPLIMVSIITILGFSCIYIIPISSLSLGKLLNWLRSRARILRVEGQKEIHLQRKGFQLVGYAFNYSCVSAFRIGVGKLSLGRLVELGQPAKYNLTAEGWVRPVSLIQTIFSWYLVLSFGAPAFNPSV